MNLAWRRGRASSVGELHVGQPGEQALEHHAAARAGRAPGPGRSAAPKPNATCSLGWRSTSKRCGSANLLVVAVRRLVEQHALLAAVQLLTPMNSTSWVTVRHMFLIGRHPAQHLLDRGRDLGGIVDQQLPLVGVQQQLLHAAADHVPGRLVAADEDQQRLVQDLVGRRAGRRRPRRARARS